MTSATKKQYSCPICNRSFNHRQTHNRHKRKHSGVKPNVCNLCQKRFWEKSDLKIHLLRHDGGVRKRFHCKFCGKPFERMHAVEIHERTHTGQRPFTCKSCNKAFQSKRSLRRHEWIHSAVPAFECHICKARFRDPRYYQLHISLHKNKKSGNLSCTSCSLYFLDKRALRKHKEIFHGIQELQCTFCQHKSITTQMFEEHTLEHIQERPIICPKCPKELRCIGSLRRHLGIHKPNREKKFPCELCPSKFYNSSSVLLHIQSHLGEKAFKCDRCAKTFVTSPELSRHLKTVHTDGIKPMQIGDGQEIYYGFECIFCQNKFTRKADFVKHIRCHIHESSYFCRLCNEGFRVRTHLKKHMLADHFEQTLVA